MDIVNFKFIVIIPVFLGQITLGNSGIVQRIYITDNKPAIKGGDVQVVCEISQFTNVDVVNVYKTDSIPPNSLNEVPKLVSCIPSMCLGNIDRHTISTSSSKVNITVNNLKRSEDQKWWTCSIQGQRKQLQLLVYTITRTLQYDNPPSQDQDLTQTSVTLKCSTGCAYPSPSFTWYHIESGGSRQEWSTSDSVTDKADGCTDSERIYTSTLTLARYTVLSSNTDKTVKFQCGAMSITGMTDQLFTPASVNVIFAVRVTSVTLKDGNTTSSSTLGVTSGISKTLTCTTSASRPTATIIWYIGTEEKKRSAISTSTLTFTPDNSDHEKTVYCKAFNLQSKNQAVSSNKSSLYVKVSVISVLLTDGNNLLSEPLHVTSDISKVLTCTTNESRPAATIVWYIGTEEKQRSSTNNSSNFTFTPQNSDHNKQIYCKAFNIQSENQAVTSDKATLYVKVPVTRVTLKYGNTIPPSTVEVTRGVSITLTCTTSASRPTATIIWFIGSEEKKRSTDSTSSLTFTPDNSDHGNHVYCKAFNLQTENQAVTSNKPSLFVKEPTIVKSFYIGERNSQPNVTVDEHDVTEFTCEVSGDPASNVKITFKGEILTELADTNELTFTHPDVDCFHSGIYTCEGNDSYGLTSSKSTTLLVKCSPRPIWQILENITSPLYVPVTIMFTAIAYPEPGPKGFFWYQGNGNRWIPLLGNEDFHVSSCGLASSLTILNVSRARFGQYRVTIENGIGTYDQHLFLSEEGLPVVDTASCKCDKESTVLLIVAVTVGIICVVLAAYATGITVLYKRKIMGKSKRYSDKASAQTTYVNTAYKLDDTKEQESAQRRENISNTTGTDENSLQQYTDLTQYSRDDKTAYDIIQRV